VDATGELLISKSAVSEITDRLWEDYQAFTGRDLSEIEVEYLFVDAVFEALRRHGAKEAVLVAWCIATDGRKHLLHLGVGNKESEACWTGFFRSMLARGLRLPTTATSDGAPGLVRAIEVCFPTTVRIRCWFHRLANIRAKLPDEAAGEVLAHLYAVRDPHPGRGQSRSGPVHQHLRPRLPGRGGMLHRRPRRPVEHPPRPGPTPDPGPHHEPVRTLLRRGTAAHQSHPPVHR
jgi:transposase-like protein